jgi:Flp pilus assembly protein CpaB
MLMIFGAAWISAALLTWLVYHSVAGPKTEKTAKVVAATRDLPAGTRLRKNDLKLVTVAENDLPKAAITDDQDRARPRSALSDEYERGAGDHAARHFVGSRRALGHHRIGKRAISVPVTDLSSAGGLIQPRSHVDVLFTRAGSMKEALTTTILQDVVVLSIGKLTEVGQTLDPKASKPQQTAATLMVTPEDARKLELAKNQGRISLALRNPLDHSVLGENTSVTAEVLDPNMWANGRRPMNARIPNVRNDRVWNELTGGEPVKKEEKKEPPKPRLVVDVYRGDKHVQEIFQ